MLNEPFEWFRLVNIIIAGLAFVLNIQKIIITKKFHGMDADAMLGFMGLMAWCLFYCVATLIAWFHDIDAGVWTALMGIPCFWSFAAGCVGWRTKEETWRSRSTAQQR